MKRFKSQKQLQFKSLALKDSLLNIHEVTEIPLMSHRPFYKLKDLSQQLAEVKKEMNESQQQVSESESKIDELISTIKKKKVEQTKISSSTLKAEQIEWQALDDWLSLLKNVQKSKRFEQSFDPIRLRMYLIYPQEKNAKLKQEMLQNDETTFMTGVRTYRKGEYLKSAALFATAAVQEPHLAYEAKFNQATAMFKVGKFQAAQVLFNNLLASQEQNFKGLDRRLYYNMSVCHLQMGSFEKCVQICNQYLKHFKDQHKNMDEIAVDFNATSSQKKLKRKDRNQTQFVKVHCHPQFSLDQMSKVEVLHPLYDFEADKSFIKELYRLKGFAYLRSNKGGHGGTKNEQALVKSAKAFEKAMGTNKDSTEEIERIRKKRNKAIQESEIMQEVRQSRVTFINYRKRLINEMLDEMQEDPLSDIESEGENQEENNIKVDIEEMSIKPTIEQAENSQQNIISGQEQSTGQSQVKSAGAVNEQQKSFVLSTTDQFFKKQAEFLQKFKKEGRDLKKSFSQVKIAAESSTDYVFAQQQLALDRHKLGQLKKLYPRTKSQIFYRKIGRTQLDQSLIERKKDQVISSNKYNLLANPQDTIKPKYYKVPKLPDNSQGATDRSIPSNGSQSTSTLVNHSPAQNAIIKALMNKLQQIETIKLNNNNFKLESRPLHLSQPQNLNPDALMWRINANIERKFALSQTKENLAHGTISDFLIQDNIQTQLKQDFINLETKGAESLLFNFLQESKQLPISRLSNEQLEVIRQSETEEQIYKALQVCLRMHFILKFPQKCRNRLLKLGRYLCLEPYQNFQPGREDIWVILRGTIQYEDLKSHVFSTLREDVLVDEAPGRMSTLETCHILSFNKIAVEEIVSQTVKDDIVMHKNLQFLKTISVFEGLSDFEMDILTTNIVQQSFKKSSFIQKEGVEPPGLVIIKQGVCLLGSHVKKSVNETDEHLANVNKSTLREESFSFVKMLVVSQIRTGSMFGGRVLLPKSIKVERQSMLSVVAYSGTVDVRIVTSEVLSKLNIHSQAIIQNNIKKELREVQLSSQENSSLPVARRSKFQLNSKLNPNKRKIKLLNNVQIIKQANGQMKLVTERSDNDQETFLNERSQLSIQESQSRLNPQNSATKMYPATMLHFPQTKLVKHHRLISQTHQCSCSVCQSSTTYNQTAETSQLSHRVPTIHRNDTHQRSQTIDSSTSGYMLKPNQDIQINDKMNASSKVILVGELDQPTSKQEMHKILESLQEWKVIKHQVIKDHQKQSIHSKSQIIPSLTDP